MGSVGGLMVLALGPRPRGQLRVVGGPRMAAPGPDGPPWGSAPYPGLAVPGGGDGVT